MSNIDLKTWLPQYNFTVNGDILNYDGCCAFSVSYADRYKVVWFMQDIPAEVFFSKEEENAKQFIMDCIEEYDDAVMRDV